MTIRICEACGFENAEAGKSCALCGASELLGAPDIDQLATLESPKPAASQGERKPPPASDAELGRVFGGRYCVESLIGSGGMGRVYRVRDLQERRELALKILHPAREGEADRDGRFKREIGILSRIRHPAVPRIFAWGTQAEELYFVTELVEGQDLKSAILKHGPWVAAEVAALAAEVADALAAAHALGIIHRDVKPNNVMLARDGSVKLLDFGLARGTGVDMATLTRTGTILGTPAYMAPEQFDAFGVDAGADLYSLGVVMFQLLTARLPFTASTPFALALRHKTEPAPSPRALRPEIPAWLERIVLRCLEKDPAKRFASASELAAELRRPRVAGTPQWRRLPGGDRVLEDAGGTSDWALVLAASKEKTGWSSGMALRFLGRYYRLETVNPPESGADDWSYGFGNWPESEVFRRLVDYDEDRAARAAAPEALKDRLARWISGRKG